MLAFFSFIVISRATTFNITWNVGSFPATTINSGDTVIWKPTDGVDHTVTFSQNNGAPEAINSGSFSGSYTIHFVTAGNYAYFCAIHGATLMSGTLVVISAPTSTATTTATTTVAATTTTTAATTAATTTTTAATTTAAATTAATSTGAICTPDCSTLPEAIASCVNGACVISSCDAPFANCDGNITNGCESNTRRDAANCGTCGFKCEKNHAKSAKCTNSACVIVCLPLFGNCDGNPANGCEIDLGTNNKNCGTCGNKCPSSQTCNGSGVCA